jgi:SAM-dependent methyltransferase
MPPTSPEHDSARPPHPLARKLIAALGGTGARVVDLASGSGRNTRALRAAGLDVLSIDDAAAASLTGPTLSGGPYRAIVSTHGLLHGTPASIGALVATIARSLEPGGLLFATFGSIRDARSGSGEEIEPFVYAPLDGDERGVPHAFFDERRLRDLIEPVFVTESIEEWNADAIAGSWAHARKPLEGSVHWFVQARAR